MTDQPAGPLIDALGVTLDVNDGQVVTEAIILCKLTDFEDGSEQGTVLLIGSSTGLDWIARRGLVSAAQFVLDQGELVEHGED